MAIFWAEHALIQDNTTRHWYRTHNQVSSRSDQSPRSYALDTQTDRQTDRQTDITNIVVTLADAREPKVGVLEEHYLHTNFHSKQLKTSVARFIDFLTFSKLVTLWPWPWDENEKSSSVGLCRCHWANQIPKTPARFDKPPRRRCKLKSATP